MLPHEEMIDQYVIITAAILQKKIFPGVQRKNETVLFKWRKKEDLNSRMVGRQSSEVKFMMKLMKLKLRAPQICRVILRTKKGLQQCVLMVVCFCKIFNKQMNIIISVDKHLHLINISTSACLLSHCYHFGGTGAILGNLGAF